MNNNSGVNTSSNFNQSDALNLNLVSLYETDAFFPKASVVANLSENIEFVGGSLSRNHLIEAYTKGIFPWYDEGPVVWYCPNVRMVLFPHKLHVSRSLQKTLKQNKFSVQFDTHFDFVIEQCSVTPRKEEVGTWINNDMIAVYKDLHACQLAHSVEVYDGNDMVGGLYGVSLGGAFFGESMFSLVRDASKVALYHLVQFAKQHGFLYIDCQIYSKHLETLGAIVMPKKNFFSYLELSHALPTLLSSWQQNYA